jgi:DNA invertase Pin-like site-specific DNA recombinase
VRVLDPNVTDERKRKMKVQYRRVSSILQNLDRQETLDYCDKIFEEKESASTKNRPALKAMLDYVRSGDHIYCHSIDRLSRSLKDLTEILDLLKAKEVAITFLAENLTFSADKDDPLATLQLQIMGAMAQWELSVSKIRQREGIEKARQRGVYLGRKKTIDSHTIKELHANGVTPTSIARSMSISRQSVYRCLAN